MTLLCFTVTKLILFATLTIGTVSSAAYDDCYGKNFTTATTSETAVVGEPKRLFCCARDYDKLVWYKNDDLIDNSRSFTTFYPFNPKNQTIISEGTRKTDKGNYICIVYVGKKVDRKVISLRVLEPAAQQWTRESAPYPAEAYGQDIPTGKYSDLFVIVLPTVAFFSCIILYITATCVEWKLELKLCCKDKYGKLEENDDKEYDVFVCYDQKNAYFVTEILVYRLEKQFEYRCFTYERDSFTGDLIPETFRENVRLSRRFLMIISPAVAVDSNWWVKALSIATEAMLNDRSKVIGLVLEEILWENISITNGTSDGETLEQVLRVIPTFQWHASSSPPRTKHKRKNNKITHIKIPDPRQTVRGIVRSWRTLRTHLPPRRKIKRMAEFRW